MTSIPSMTSGSRALDGKVRYLVLIGQTSDKIAECAKKHGFTDIMYAEDLQEAVQVCILRECGDNVLLSPACASWGMFKNFEERGRKFGFVKERFKVEKSRRQGTGAETAGTSSDADAERQQMQRQQMSENSWSVSRMYLKRAKRQQAGSAKRKP